jgi:Rrf2 family protein
MRISARIDYAVRALIELAVLPPGTPGKADDIATAQDIPVSFLLTILGELKQANLVRSQRGREGGYLLAWPAADITVADIARALEGPLANIRDISLQELTYPGPAEPLLQVWMALRTNMRDVLEQVTIADLAANRVPKRILDKAAKYAHEEQRRHPRRGRGPR